MRRTLRDRAGALLVVSAAALVALTVGSAASASNMVESGLAANSMSYSDPAGDANGGTDVSQITVSSDDSGVVHFRVVTPNVAQLPSGAYLIIAVDSNRDGNGDYHIVFSGGFTPSLFSENPSTLLHEPSFQATYAQGATASVNRAAIGTASTDGFQFNVYTKPMSNSSTDSDVAPNTGWYAYTFAAKATITSLSVPLASLKFNVDPLRAGKVATLTFKVFTNTGAPLPTGAVACHATVGRTKINGSGSVRAGAGRCSWWVPRSAAGKTLTASGAVSFPGATGYTFSSAEQVVGATTLRLGARSQTPGGAQVGQTFFLGIGVFVHTVGVSPDPRIQHGVAICHATIDGRAVPLRLQHVAAGAGAQCAWGIPATARGHTLVATIGARSGNTSIRRTFRILVH